MLRIANYYESQLGRNDGNPLYVTVFLKRVQYYCQKKNGNLDPKLLGAFPTIPPVDARAEAFAEWFMTQIDSDGLEIHHARPWGDLDTFGKFDLHLWVDWGEDGLKGLLPYEPIYPPGHPLIYWASDTHLGLDYRIQMAKQADLVFCAQKRGVEDMVEAGVEAPVLWMPHAVEPLAYPHYDLASQKYDIGFVGHINSANRIDALDRMFKEFPNFYYGQLLFEQAARKYAESRIVFNMSHQDDINMRCFEVLGAGGFLLTNALPTLPLVGLEDGVHLATYETIEEAVEKAHYYLEHENERFHIAEMGHLKVMADHTFANRMQQVFEAVEAYGLIEVEA